MKERPILFSGAMVRAILAGQKTQTRRVVKVPWKGSSRALPYEPYWVDSDGVLMACDQYGDYHRAEAMLDTYGRPGDRLWVRETWCPALIIGETATVAYRADGDDPNAKTAMDVRANAEQRAQAWRFLERGHWCPAIHMPRWASRITLEVAEVRVQRLQEISEEDARAEGVEPVVHEHWTAYDPATEGYPSFGVEPDAEMIARNRLENVRRHGPKVLSTARQQFERLWQSINGERPGCSWANNPWVWCVSFRRLP